MNEDDRCCGTGTCIIDANGLCWCGQQWDGEKMCHPALAATSSNGFPINRLDDMLAKGPQLSASEQQAMAEDLGAVRASLTARGDLWDL